MLLGETNRSRSPVSCAQAPRERNWASRVTLGNWQKYPHGAPTNSKHRACIPNHDPQYYPVAHLRSICHAHRFLRAQMKCFKLCSSGPEASDDFIPCHNVKGSFSPSLYVSLYVSRFVFLQYLGVVGVVVVLIIEKLRGDHHATPTTRAGQKDPGVAACTRRGGGKQGNKCLKTVHPASQSHRNQDWSLYENRIE